MTNLYDLAVAGAFVSVSPEIAEHHEEHFRTEHLVQDIGPRAISAGFITIGAQAGKFILNFVAAAVLARLLSPKDFGLVGMVLGITGLVAVFSQMGLSIATIQRDSITQAQVSNLFWINVGLSGGLALVSVAIAPLAASFYHDTRVTNIMVALSMTFVLTGSTVQHQALLTRQMRFRTLTTIDVTSSAVGVAIGCCMAYFKFAYWALVGQQLGTAACNLVLTWFMSGWRPHLPSRNSGVKPLLSFGAHLGLADFIAQVSLNCDSVLLGRYFGAEPLGLYTRANVLLTRPLQQVMIPINSILTPSLSRLQSDPERYRRSVMRAYDTLALIVFCFAAMCFVLASPLVLLVLGPKWGGVIPLFAGFSVVAVSAPLSYICPWLYESQGRGKDQLRNHILAGGVTVIAYIAGLPWGPMGVVISLAIASLFVRLPIVYYIAGRQGPVSTRDLWTGFLSHLPCWGAVCLTTTLVFRVVAHTSPIVQLLICGPVGLATGIALILVFPRPRQSVLYVWNMLRGALARQLRPAVL